SISITQTKSCRTRAVVEIECGGRVDGDRSGATQRDTAAADGEGASVDRDRSGESAAVGAHGRRARANLGNARRDRCGADGSGEIDGSVTRRIQRQRLGAEEAAGDIK